MDDFERVAIMTATNKKTIEDIDVAGKKVLVRCDFNVPIKEGVIRDDKRIRESLRTIRYLIDHKARVILCSHLGRPAGTGFEEAFSLAPIAKRLSELLGQEVVLAQRRSGRRCTGQSRRFKRRRSDAD